MKCLWILFFFFLHYLYAQKTPSITLDVKGSELIVQLPKFPEVKTILFSADINNECVSDYNFVHDTNITQGETYKIDVRKTLMKDDLIRIVGVFESNNHVNSHAYDFKIDNHGNAVMQNIPEKISEKCNCIKSETEQNFVTHDCSGDLIFKENFDDQLLTSWTHEVRSLVLAAPPDQEFVAYVNKKENCHINDGILNLTAIWVDGKYNKFRVNNCTSKKSGKLYTYECGTFRRKGGVSLPPVFTAKLHSKQKFNFKYGRVEIRARMPIGDWLFPYLILQPVNTNSEDSHVNQIRIAYARGNKILQNKNSLSINGEVLFGSAVLWTNNGSTEYRTTYRNLPGRLFGDDFHVYTLIWHKHRLIYKVDGYTFGIITDKKVLNELSLNECFITLGLTAGGAVNFSDDYLKKYIKPFLNKDAKAADLFSEKTNRKSWKHPSLLIDYVHVYTTHSNEE